MKNIECNLPDINFNIKVDEKNYEKVIKKINESIITFEKNTEKTITIEYIVDSKIKSKVNFKRHDLILDSYEKDFDLILCRNVIIYFKDEVKQKIIEDFIKSLKVGGLLFVGATESINTYKTSGLEKLSPFIYKKIYLKDKN